MLKELSSSGKMKRTKSKARRAVGLPAATSVPLCQEEVDFHLEYMSSVFGQRIRQVLPPELYQSTCPDSRFVYRKWWHILDSRF